MRGNRASWLIGAVVQRMFVRSVSLAEVLETLSKGKLCFDPKYNSYVRHLVIEGGKGVVVVLRNGALATVYLAKKVSSRMTEVAF